MAIKRMVEMMSFIWQKAVIDKDILTPPGTPVTGNRYLINGIGTGVWTGQDYNIAMWTGSAWEFTTKLAGMHCWVTDESKVYRYTGTVWEISPEHIHNNFNLLQTYTQTETNLADAVAKKHDGTTQDTAIAAKIPLAQKGVADGVATLGTDGKIPSGQLPAIAITDTFVVASEAAMLALTAEIGDVAIRTDISKSFILQTAPASILANWKELLTPPDVVQSVNGLIGVVTLTQDEIGNGVIYKRIKWNAALECFEVDV